MTPAERIAWLRQKVFGERGGKTAFAKALGIRFTTYTRYENGDSAPSADILARMMLATQANPRWITDGEDPVFLPALDVGSRSEQASDVISRLAARVSELQADLASSKAGAVVHEALERRPRGAGAQADAAAEGEAAYGRDLVAVPILTSGAGPASTQAARDWAVCRASDVPNLQHTFALRVHDDSMADLVNAGGLVGVDRSVTDIEAILRGRPPLAVIRDPDTQQMVVREAEQIGGPDAIIFRPRNRTVNQPPVLWRADQPSPVVGKVVWLYSGV